MRLANIVPMQPNPFITDYREPETFDQILKTVCQYFEVTKAEVKSEARERRISNARFIIMFLAYRTGRYSVEKIGKLLNRHHSTVVYGKQSCKDYIGFDPVFRESFKEIEKLLLQAA